MTGRKIGHILCMIIFLATVCVSHAQNTAAQEEFAECNVYSREECRSCWARPAACSRWNLRA